MIRRYSAKSKEELLLLIWMDTNQDFPVSHFQWLVESCQQAEYCIERTLNVLDVHVALWRAAQ